jgi:hypothetical protein
MRRYIDDDDDKMMSAVIAKDGERTRNSVQLQQGFGWFPPDRILIADVAGDWLRP